MIRRAFAVFAMALCVAGFVPGSAQAGSILVSDTTSASGGSVSDSGGHSTFAQFTLTDAATITSASLLISVATGSTLPDSDLSLAFYENGIPPGSQVAGSSTATTSATIGTTKSLINFTFSSPVSLDSGTYYLGLTNANSEVVNWGFHATASTLTNIGTDGTVDQLEYENAPGTGAFSDAMVFSITGTLTPASSDVPEIDPGSAFAALSLLSMGVAMMRRRTRKSA